MKYLYHIMQILNGKPLHRKQGEIKMEDYIEELIFQQNDEYEDDYFSDDAEEQ